jgi:membrane protein CcdC involved in cytochrome C biogenesis
MVVIVPDTSNMNQMVFFIILIIIILQLRERKVKSWGLIIVPVFMSLITILVVYNVLFSSILNFFLITAGFILGLVIGIVIGSFMRVKIDEKDGSLVLKGSIVAVILWIAIIALKIYGQDFLAGTRLIDLTVLTSIFLMMALGAIISRRIFIYRKYLEYKKVYKIEKHSS